MIRSLEIDTTVIVDVSVLKQTAQAQLDFHNTTSQIMQEQIELQNQLEMHTTDLLTKPLSDDSSVIFLENQDTPNTSPSDQMEHQPLPQKKSNTFR